MNLLDRLAASDNPPELAQMAQRLATHLLDRHNLGDGTANGLDPGTMELEPCCTNALINAANEVSA